MRGIVDHCNNSIPFYTIDKAILLQFHQEERVLLRNLMEMFSNGRGDDDGASAFPKCRDVNKREEGLHEDNTKHSSK